jgi:uncharacterized protein (DUF934 family)
MRFIDSSEDCWQAVSDQAVPRTGPVLFTLEQWATQRDTWPRDRAAGVCLPNTADVEALGADVQHWALIVLQFPKWTDGRAYSQARLLRTRLRFGGEVRATGDALVDMVPLLQRSGFDAVQLRSDQNMDAAQRALRFFAGHYQGDVTERRPLFARQPS